MSARITSKTRAPNPRSRITDLDPHPPRIPVSPKKLAANRRNATKSTGPRTPEGKQTVSQSALKNKHGCSQSALLPNECDATYEIFEAELREDLRPRTALQWHLVSQISQILWKLQRTADTERHLYHLNSNEGDPACHTLANA